MRCLHPVLASKALRAPANSMLPSRKLRLHAQLLLNIQYQTAPVSGAHHRLLCCLHITMRHNLQGLQHTMNCAGMISGIFGFPSGVLIGIVSGAEVSTANTAIVAAATLEGKTTVLEFVKSWTVSWVGNLFGSVFLAWMTAQTGILVADGAAAALSVSKTTVAFWPVRGTLTSADCKLRTAHCKSHCANCKLQRKCKQSKRTRRQPLRLNASAAIP